MLRNELLEYVKPTGTVILDPSFKKKHPEYCSEYVYRKRINHQVQYLLFSSLRNFTIWFSVGMEASFDVKIDGERCYKIEKRF